MTKYVDQVGGAHYQTDSGPQHWDVMEEFDVSYLEAVATKYLSRWRQKGGAEDLRKSLTYLEKMGERTTRKLVPVHRITWVTSEPELEITKHILSYGSRPALQLAARAIKDLIELEERRT